MNPTETTPSLSTLPRPGFVETFNNREARWRAVAGSWEITANGVRVAPSRVATWYVCNVVRPPDYAVIEATLNAHDAGSQDTGAAAVSVITDQGHRALSAALDVKNRRLLLMGQGTEQLGEAALPDRFDPNADHHLVLRRNGPTLEAQLDDTVVRGALKRSIAAGRLAFWTDPGVEATFKRLSITRGFTDSPPFSGVPKDWQTAAGHGSTWNGNAAGFQHIGGEGYLVKNAGTWDDVQIAATFTKPGNGANAGFGLRHHDGTLLTYSVSPHGIRLVWDEGKIRQDIETQITEGDAVTLTLRKAGDLAHLWADEKYLATQQIPPVPGEIMLTATGTATVHSLTVTEWI